MNNQQLHQGQPVLTFGQPLEDAKGVMILVHGRGATANSILSLAELLYDPDLAYLAPQAAGNTWYPYSFLVAIKQNEPWLSSALQQLTDLCRQIANAGIPTSRLILAGFSQGACLVSEFVSRNAQQYGGVFVFSGGVIGPAGTVWASAGNLDQTPIFLGCSDNDSHIPQTRVLETAQLFRQMGGNVTVKLYPNIGHTIIEDELTHARRIVTRLNKSWSG